jgi:hypothetical protein
MKRRMLALALCVLAGPSTAMTAAVAPASQQPSSMAGAAASGSGADAPNKPAPAAAQSGGATSVSRASMPSAASVTKPATTLSAPDVPTKAAPAAKGAAMRDKATIQPAAKATAPAATNSAWNATARGGTGMRRGTLEAINMRTATLQVYGQKLGFDPQRVKVFDRNGRPGSIFALKSGAKVRFTIDTTDTAQRRVAVIYVD